MNGRIDTHLPPMFIQRALITFTLGPLILYFVYLGGLAYFVTIAIVLILATAEYTRMLQKIGWHPSFYLLVVMVFAQWALAQWPWPALADLIFLISLLLILGYTLWLYEKEISQTVPADWMAMTTGLILLGWAGSHFFRLRGLEDMAWQWTMLAMLSTWIADSGAYLVGKFVAGKFLLGKHQLSPRLSPNKTIEGYIGGILLGTSCTLLSAKILQLPLEAAVLLGLLVSIVSPLGDLGISLIKREAGLKDSGSIFPGHGGALDRIDSLVWSVTMTYYLALFVA
jgi:phosphatidate cytidylyltransferase